VAKFEGCVALKGARAKSFYLDKRERRRPKLAGALQLPLGRVGGSIVSEC